MKNEFKEYQIAGVTFHQSELCWGENVKLSTLISSIIKGSEGLSLDSDITEILEESQHLTRFFDIILKSKKNFRYFVALVAFHIKKIVGIVDKEEGFCSYVYGQCPNSIVKQVFTDFFFLNSSLIDKLKDFGRYFEAIREVENQEEVTPKPSA